MDYKFFTDMMRNEVNKQPAKELKIGRKIEEEKKDKSAKTDEESILADVTKVNKDGEGPSIDAKQPEAPEQKGESLEDEADQLKSLKDNDKKDQINPELVEDPKGKKKVKEGIWSPEEQAADIMDDISSDESLVIIRDALEEAGEDDSIMDDIYDDASLGIIRDALEAYFRSRETESGSNDDLPPMPEVIPEAKINEAPFQGKSEADKEATAEGEEPPADNEPTPDAPEDLAAGGGKPPKPKGEEEEVPEEPVTEEPKKKVTLGKSADQFFYFQPNEQGGVVLDAEEKEIKKINPGPILPQILDIVRELKIDLVGAQFVTDYVLPEVEAKHADEEKTKKDMEPAEEMPVEEEPVDEELPVPPAAPNESVSKDFLTQLYEGQEGML